MRNPKEFKATPFNHFKPVDKSHTGTHELAHNGTRTEQMTPWSHNKPVPHSATGRGELKHNGTRTEMATPHNYSKPVKHSMPDVPKEPKKWHKKGYTVTGPVEQDF